VFVSELGGPLPKDRLRDGLYAALAAAGIDRKNKGLFPAKGGFTFHDLRHTFVTFAAQVYRSLVDVQAYAGHAQIQTTMKYAHHVEKHDAAALFSEFVAKQKGAETVSRTVSRSAEYSGTKLAASGGYCRA
jgi:integrase